jgi:hypothetical protein
MSSANFRVYDNIPLDKQAEALNVVGLGPLRVISFQVDVNGATGSQIKSIANAIKPTEVVISGSAVVNDNFIWDLASSPTGPFVTLNTSTGALGTGPNILLQGLTGALNAKFTQPAAGGMPCVGSVGPHIVAGFSATGAGTVTATGSYIVNLLVSSQLNNTL